MKTLNREHPTERAPWMDNWSETKAELLATINTDLKTAVAYDCPNEFDQCRADRIHIQLCGAAIILYPDGTWAMEDTAGC